MIFKNRNDAGIQQAKQLKQYQNAPDTLVVALPRGGIVNGYEIAKELNLPLDIILSKKIGAPHNPELAIGSVGMDGTVIIDNDIVSSFAIPSNYIEEQTKQIKEKINKKLHLLRGNAGIPDLKGKTVILVDDGIATGYTMLSAINFLKTRHPQKIIISVAVAPQESINALKKQVDEIHCARTPMFMGAIGAFYKDFTQVTDQEAAKYLKKLK